MPLRGACCELSWCEPVEARVRSVGVVVDPPFFDDLARLLEVDEQVLVETLVAQSAERAASLSGLLTYSLPIISRNRGMDSCRPSRRTMSDRY